MKFLNQVFKFLLPVSVLIVAQFSWAGESGGGGSFQRLLKHAGLKPRAISPVPNNITDKMAHDAFDKALKYAFNAIANNVEFAGNKFTIFAGTQVIPTQFVDAYGQTITMTELNLNAVRVIAGTINDENQLGHIEWVDQLGVLATGEAVTAVNIPQQQKILVSTSAIKQLLSLPSVLETQLLPVAMAAHELLSLAGIEDENNYAVSSTFVRNDIPFPNFHLRCEAIDGSPKRLSLTVKGTKGQLVSNFSWSAAFAPSQVVELDVSKPKEITWAGEEGYSTSALTMGFERNISSGSAIPNVGEMQFILKQDKPVDQEGQWAWYPKVSIEARYSEVVNAGSESYLVPHKLVFVCSQPQP
jgi:hypothetical protein